MEMKYILHFKFCTIDMYWESIASRWLWITYDTFYPGKPNITVYCSTNLRYAYFIGTFGIESLPYPYMLSWPAFIDKTKNYTDPWPVSKPKIEQ